MLRDVYVWWEICGHGVDDFKSTPWAQRSAICRIGAGADDKDSYELNMDKHRKKAWGRDLD